MGGCTGLWFAEGAELRAGVQHARPESPAAEPPLGRHPGQLAGVNIHGNS